jgi:CRISPR/Cas system-associated exonuclease Cas4 (RecB family)
MDTKSFLFSASSFKDYLQCGLKFKFSRIDKAERTETATHHRWFGSLVHALIYYSIADYEGNSKTMNLRKRVRKKAALDMLEDLWKSKAKNSDAEIILKSIGDRPTGKFSRGKIKSLGNNNENISQEDLEEGWLEEAKIMLGNGIDVISGIHKIIELEKKIMYHVKGYKFMGFVDVLAQDSDGKYEFYDFKTSWEKPSQNDLHNDFQFFGYAKALSEDDKLGINEDYFPKGNWVFLRKGENISYELKKDKFWEMIRLTQSVMSNIEANIFLPDYGGPLCKFCDFRHICYGSDDKIWSRGK